MHAKPASQERFGWLRWTCARMRRRFAMCRQLIRVKQPKKKVSLHLGGSTWTGCGLNSPQISKTENFWPMRNLYLKFFFSRFLCVFRFHWRLNRKLQFAPQFLTACSSEGVDSTTPNYLRLTPQGH